jgi:uncharacterized protein YndB with AHSA1/START domain
MSKQDHDIHVQSTSNVMLVRKTITVAAPVETAFRVFTEEIARWWPLASHHVGDVDAETVVIEPFVGGRAFERGVDGSEGVWGHVLTWDPPHTFALSWELSADFRCDPTIRTEVEVRFSPDGGASRVDLEHRLLEQYGDRAEEMRGVFDSPDGWYRLLQRYAARASQV